MNMNVVADVLSNEQHSPLSIHHPPFSIQHSAAFTIMNIIDTQISDVKIIEPKVFDDERGFFF